MIFAADIESAVTREECEALAELAKGKLVLEMGSWKGRSTIAMASVAKRVFSVDTHENVNIGELPNTYREFMKNLVRYGVDHKILCYVGRFEDIVPKLHRPFDLVFIDGDHSLLAVARDTDLALKALTPYTSPYPRGVIAFHDYGLKELPGNPEVPFGVTEVVDDLAKRCNEKPTVVQTLAILNLGS